MGTGRCPVSLAVTLLLASGAVVAGWVAWVEFTAAPWTRDGQVQGCVVDVALEVSGRIVQVDVADNQEVCRGDMLYEIEPIDFEIALATAQANVQSRQAYVAAKQQQASRRTELTTLSTSMEEKQTYQASADVASLSCAYASAQAQLSQARIDLERTKVVSPVNGYVTSLQVRAGDYATKSSRNISVGDRDSF